MAAAALADAHVNGEGGGIGIMLGACGDLWLAGVDLDTCRNSNTGAIEAWATEVLERLGTYSEISPSETGVKLFFLLRPEDVSRLRPLMAGEGKNSRTWKRPNGTAHPPAIELHLDKRYFAVTWEGLDDAPAELRTVSIEDLLWLIETAGPKLAGKPNSADDTKPGTDSSNDILARLDRAACHDRAIATALQHAATMHGGSRSEGAMGLGATLKRAGWSYADMKAALLACAVTKEWATESDERQFERI